MSSRQAADPLGKLFERHDRSHPGVCWVYDGDLETQSRPVAGHRIWVQKPEIVGGCEEWRASAAAMASIVTRRLPLRGPFARRMPAT